MSLKMRKKLPTLMLSVMASWRKEGIVIILKERKGSQIENTNLDKGNLEKVSKEVNLPVSLFLGSYFH